MERELWPVFYRHLKAVAKDFSQEDVQFQPRVLVAVMLRAAPHDRPVSWACDPKPWRTTTLQPPRLPSPSTLSRRVDGVAVGLLGRALEQRLRRCSGEHPGLVAFLDGKPLTVSGVTKDRDARYGRAAGTKGKGYKLHAAWAGRAAPEAWEVTPWNVCEKQVARRLIPQLAGGGYLLGDGNYGASPLYDLAAARGDQLVGRPRKGNAGKGHHSQSPHRLRAIALRQGDFGRALYAARGAIERSFGNAGSFGGGLQPLPSWVRGRDRVRTWVWAKLLINAAPILRNKDLPQP